jgi:pimeloyl-ACP methyl ester carboxylesterase
MAVRPLEEEATRPRLQLNAFRNPPPPTPTMGEPDPYGDPDPEWLRIDWRRHLKRIEVMDATVNYCEMGEGGEPIVFVHGLAGCWQNWLENIPYFARTHRVVALDLPGFGNSPMPPWEVTIPNYGKLVDEFCRRLNLHSCLLVGNSMGGFIAAEAAIAQPEWVDKLVLVSAAGISSVYVSGGGCDTPCTRTCSTPRTSCGRSCCGSSRTAPPGLRRSWRR